MSLETERELYVKMKAGDDYAREDLIMGHDWLVEKMVRKYSNNADPEDVRQEAWMALIKVVDRYDIEKGRLGNYAPYFMKKDIVRYLDKQRHLIRLPAGPTNAMIRLLWIREEIECDLGRMPTKEELKRHAEVISEYNKFKRISKMKIDLDTFVSYLDFAEPVHSLQDSIPDTEELILEDLIPDPRSEEHIDLTDTRDLLRKILSVLDQEELAVHNLLSMDYTRKEVCEKLNMEPNRFDYIKRRCREKVDKFVASNKDIQEALLDMPHIWK